MKTQNELMPNNIKIAAKHWGQQATKDHKWRDKWFLNRQVIEHSNFRICGKPLRLEGQGVTELLQQELNDSPLKRGISVGCGIGNKEIALLKSGIVDTFELWEISDIRVQLATENVAANGLSGQVIVRHGDAFEQISKASYDLVHWNMSLHHMPSVKNALEWSYRALKPGGWLYIHELAGPDHYQWTDSMLEVANRVRKSVPEHWLVDYTGRKASLATEVKRPSLASMMKRDPTECQNSSAILPAITDIFPQAKVIPIGGIVFYLGLDGCYENMTEDDRDVLAAYLLLDEVLADNGLWLYLAALAQKISEKEESPPHLHL